MTARFAARRFYEAHVHDDTDECIIWPFSVGSHGYGQLNVNGKPQNVHVLSCTEWHGPAPRAGMEAAHECGRNPRCFNGRHLRWKSVAENQADRLRDGTDQRGERNTQSKLTQQDVRTIRRLVKNMTHAAVAAQFGVSPTTVDDIIAKRTWKWLK